MGKELLLATARYFLVTVQASFSVSEHEHPHNGLDRENVVITPRTAHTSSKRPLFMEEVLFMVVIPRHLTFFLRQPMNLVFPDIGDTKQFGPRSVTSIDKTYKALFEAQRRCNLLKRVQATGHIDFTLSANHRAHGDVHDWARGALYVSDLKTVNGKKRRGVVDTIADKTYLRIINRGIDSDSIVFKHQITRS